MVHHPLSPPDFEKSPFVLNEGAFSLVYFQQLDHNRCSSNLEYCAIEGGGAPSD